MRAVLCDHQLIGFRLLLVLSLAKIILIPPFRDIFIYWRCSINRKIMYTVSLIILAALIFGGVGNEKYD